MRKILIAIAFLLFLLQRTRVQLPVIIFKRKSSVVFLPSPLGCQPGHPSGEGQVPSIIGSFVISKNLTYPFRWDPDICSYAKADAHAEALAQCHQSGHKEALLYNTIEDFCSYPQTIDVTERCAS